MIAQLVAHRQTRRSSMGPGCTSPEVGRPAVSTSTTAASNPQQTSSKPSRRSSMGPGCMATTVLGDDATTTTGGVTRPVTLPCRNSLKNLGIPILLAAGAASMTNLESNSFIKCADAFAVSGFTATGPSSQRPAFTVGHTRTGKEHQQDVSQEGNMRAKFGYQPRSNSMPLVSSNSSCSSNNYHSRTSLNLIADATALTGVADTAWTTGGFFSSSLLTAGNTASHIAASIRPAPGMETFLMTKANHLLDIGSIMNPESMAIKSITFFERAMDMASDIDPSKRDSVSLDDVIYQGGMLAASVKQIAESLQKMVGGTANRILKNQVNPASSFRDHVAFHGLFSKVGMTRAEFDHLLSTGALSWVDVEPNSDVNNDHRTGTSSGDSVSSDKDSDNSSVYWLYNGGASIMPLAGTSSSADTRTLKYRRRGKAVSKFLLANDIKGDPKTLHSDPFNHEKYSKKAFDSELLADPRSLSHLMGFKEQDSNGADMASSRLVVADEGATLLKLDVAKIGMAMEEDAAMDRKFRNLVYLSMRSETAEMMEDVNIFEIPF